MNGDFFLLGKAAAGYKGAIHRLMWVGLRDEEVGRDRKTWIDELKIPCPPE